MTKIFIPARKGRIKINVRGFWYSKDTNKTYYDYLKVKDYPANTLIDKYYLNQFFNFLELLQKSYNQECIAYVDNDVLSIFYNRNLIERFNRRIYSEVKPESFRQEIRAALKLYGGITIYKEGIKYFKEIF